MAFEAEGIWGHIVSHAEKVEIPELARIIGVKYLEDNSNLWKELKAFSSILSDLASMDLNGNGPDDSIFFKNKERKDSSFSAHADSSSSMGGPWTTITEDNLRSRRDIPCLDLTPGTLQHHTASNNSGHESNNSTSRKGSQLTGRSARSMDSLEFVLSIEENINVRSISAVVDSIRDALRSEKEDLKSEISVLQQAMDGETDLISARAASAADSKGNKDKKRKISRFQKNSCHSQGRANDNNDNHDVHEAGNMVCEVCSLPTQEFEPGKIRPQKKAGSSTSSVPPTLSSIGISRQEYLSKLSGQLKDASSTRKQQQRDLSILCTSCKDRLSQSTTPASDGVGIAMNGKATKSNRMRSKLQAARDEKHFLEFDM